MSHVQWCRKQPTGIGSLLMVEIWLERSTWLERRIDYLQPGITVKIAWDVPQDIS